MLWTRPWVQTIWSLHLVAWRVGNSGDNVPRRHSLGLQLRVTIFWVMMVISKTLMATIKLSITVSGFSCYLHLLCLLIRTMVICMVVWHELLDSIGVVCEVGVRNWFIRVQWSWPVSTVSRISSRPSCIRDQSFASIRVRGTSWRRFLAFMRVWAYLMVSSAGVLCCPHLLCLRCNVLLASLAIGTHLLSLLWQELGKVHGLRENNVVLVELDTAHTACLVCLLTIYFEADFLLGQDHISRVIKAHLPDFLAFNYVPLRLV